MVEYFTGDEAQENGGEDLEALYKEQERIEKALELIDACVIDSYVGWLQHCDSFRLYQKYVEPNVEYMHNYYLKEVKGNAEICKRKNYSGERKAS